MPSDELLTPAQADAELLERGAELSATGAHDEIERLAAIADEGDEDAAVRAWPPDDGWTAADRTDWIAGMRRSRRRWPHEAMRPGETAAAWRDRRIALYGGHLPLVIPAHRREDVVEIDLGTLGRRDRERLLSCKPERLRRQVVALLRPVAPCAPTARTGARPRGRRPRRSARRSAARAGPSDGGGESEPPGEVGRHLDDVDRRRRL